MKVFSVLASLAFCMVSITLFGQSSDNPSVKKFIYANPYDPQIEEITRIREEVSPALWDSQADQLIGKKLPDGGMLNLLITEGTVHHIQARVGETNATFIIDEAGELIFAIEKDDSFIEAEGRPAITENYFVDGVLIRQLNNMDAGAPNSQELRDTEGARLLSLCQGYLAMR